MVFAQSLVRHTLYVALTSVAAQAWQVLPVDAQDNLSSDKKTTTTTQIKTEVKSGAPTPGSPAQAPTQATDSRTDRRTDSSNDATNSAASSSTSTTASATTATVAPANSAATRPVNEKILPFIKEGYAFLQKNENVKAIKVLRKAIAMDKECISGRRYLAYALVKEKDYKGALEELQKVSKLVTPNAFDFYLFGEAYYGANGTKQAQDCYSEALHQNQKYDAARVGLVKTFARENKFEDAFNTLQEGVQNANDAAVKRYYASLTKAVTEAQAASRAQPGIPQSTDPANNQVGSTAVKTVPVILK